MKIRLTKTGSDETLHRYSGDSERWNAVQQRDEAADCHFFYSVATTGVYCRPACPSRLPLRQNVAFHSTAAAAEKAGFRPCKRCLPNGSGISAHHAMVVAKACRIIEAEETAPKLIDLSRGVGMSAFHLHRIFKKITGLSPRTYAAARRAESVRNELSKSRSVTDAIFKAGYNSSGRFYAKSNETLGMKPQSYRAGGAGMNIRFAFGQSTLGSLLVAATEKGICAIFLGAKREELTADLRHRFPQAHVVKGDRVFGTTVAKVVKIVDNPRLGTHLPLDIQGTAFQQRVWTELGKIPLGKTATYAEVAKRMGVPKAVRAVAGACGANKIAVIIPCHRVIRSDGRLSGYRWGVDLKRALLDQEKSRD